LSGRAFWISVAASWLGALVVLLLLVLSCLDMHWEGEYLGLNAAAIVRGMPIGFMSPLSVFCFVLVSVAFLVSLSRRSKIRRWRLALALGSAGVLLITCLIFLLAFLLGTPLLYSGAFFPPAFSSLLAFIVLGVALMILTRRDGGLMDESSTDGFRTAFYFILIFVILAVGIVTAGYIHYRRYETRFREEVEQQLSAIAELKVNELTRWRKERLADASIFFNNPSFTVLVRRFFEHPTTDTDAQRQLQDWLGKYQVSAIYNRIRLLDVQGLTRLSLPADLEPSRSDTLWIAAEALRSGQIAIEDLNRHQYSERIYLSMMVPIIDKSDVNRPLGVLVLRIDPASYLYPFMQRWPTPSKTAETLLVRKDVNDVLYLSDLRHQPNAALALRIPLKRTKVPAVRAILGQTGIIEGVDYHDVPVIASVRAVPDSPWFLIAKLDVAEVQAPLRTQLWQMVTLIGVLLLGAAAGVGLVWRQRRVRFYRDKAGLAEQLRENETELRATLESTVDGILAMNSKGKVLQASQRFLELWRIPQSLMERSNDWTMLDFVQSQLNDPDTFLRNVHSLYDSDAEDMDMFTFKDGRVYESYSVPMIVDGTRTGRVWSFRDITARKQAEEEAQQYNRQLEVLSLASQQVNIVLEIPMVMRKLIAVALELTGATDGTAGLMLDGQMVFKEYNLRGQLTPIDYCFAEGHGVPGLVMHTRVPYISNDAEHDPYVIPEIQQAFAFRNLADVPIFNRRGELLGCLEIHNKPGGFNDTDVLMLQGLAASAAIALENAVMLAERQEAEAGLRESEERYRALFDRAYDGICLLSVTGDVLSANQSFAFMHGYSVKEMLSMSLKDLETPKSSLLASERLRRLVAGESLVMEVKHLHKDGHVFPLEVSVSQISFDEKSFLQCIHRDITERKRAEEKMEQLSQKNELILGAAGEGILGLDCQGNHTFINPAAAKMLGYEAAELLGLPSHNIWHHTKPDRSPYPEEECNICAAYRDGTVYCSSTEMFRRKDGTSFPVEYESTPMYEQERLVGAVLTFSDITERKQAEERMQHLLIDLERSNSELEQFANIASHDLQEPLRMVSSYTQLLALRYEGQLDEKAKKYIDYAVDGAIRMQRIINDLLDYSRVGRRGNPIEITDINSVMGAAISNLDVMIKESKVVITNDDLPAVSADASQLVQLLQNLLANAIKFRGEDIPRIHVSVRADEREWIFAVRDNGIGIDPQHAERVFVIFQRLHTREEYPGTGIGLAVCKRIVERHKGRIWFESEPGKSTTFFFTIPK
jgi:PAS domain S-box-containing protein